MNTFDWSTLDTNPSDCNSLPLQANPEAYSLASIDSMTVAVPFSEITFIDKSFELEIGLLSEPVRVVKSTLDGSVISDGIENPRDKKGVCRIYHTELNGVRLFSTHYRFQGVGNNICNRPASINFTLSAMLLGQRYFEGFTLDTLRLAYDAILAQGVISFSYDSFLTAYASDIDVKTDYSVDCFYTLSKRCEASLYDKHKPHFVLRTGSRRGRPTVKSCTGFTVYDRKTKDFSYLKLYDKVADLSGNVKHVNFARAYLSGIEFPNGRLEANFPNTILLRRFGLLPPKGVSCTVSFIVDSVRANGMAALNKVQTSYISFPLLEPEAVSPSGELKGTEPSAHTQRRALETLHLLCLGSHCNVDVAITLIKSWTRPLNHAWLVNYAYRWAGAHINPDYYGRVKYKSVERPSIVDDIQI